VIASAPKPILALVALLAFCVCFVAPSGGRVKPPADVRQISLIGALQLQPSNARAHADVAGYKDFAFIGKWGGVCSGQGADIIDISIPSTPVKIASTLSHPFTSMEDMKAIRIGARDVLAVGLQECGEIPTQGKSGLELYDITNPNDPQLLSFVNVDSFGADVHGIHELDLTTTPNGRALALAAVPDLEFETRDSNGGQGDLLIIDITDPTEPVVVGEWGVIDQPDLGPSFYASARQGSDPRVFGHSARANQNGTRVYVSYWDAGVIALDINDPAHPVYLGRTSFAPGDEGNAHSSTEARGGNVLIQADEDFDAFGPGGFNGWGYLRTFDIGDLSSPVQLSTFATENTNNEAVAMDGNWTVHNPEARGNTVYASWYNDGVRVIDISQVSAPHQIAFWTGAGAPSDAPAVNIWSVVPHQNLLLVSDRNYGLYVLRPPIANN
jgi:hypothetical protein